MVWMYVMIITTPWGSPHSSSLSAKNHKTDPRGHSPPTSKIPCEHKIKSAALPQLQGLVWSGPAIPIPSPASFLHSTSAIDFF